MEEKEIRRLIRSSPDEGYRQLFEQYHAYAFAVVFRTLGGAVSSRDAEDCVVDVFADVIMHFDSSYDGSIQAYIGAAARNKAINLKRARAASDWYTVSDEAAENVPDGETDVEKAAENAQTLRLVLEKTDNNTEILLRKELKGDSPDSRNVAGSGESKAQPRAEAAPQGARGAWRDNVMEETMDKKKMSELISAADDETLKKIADSHAMISDDKKEELYARIVAKTDSHHEYAAAGEHPGLSALRQLSRLCSVVSAEADCC